MAILVAEASLELHGYKLALMVYNLELQIYYYLSDNFESTQSSFFTNVGIGRF